MSKNLFWFIGLVLLLSWTLVFCIKAFELGSAPMTTAMALPMLLALLFILRSGEDRFSDIGWKGPGWKFISISVFLPLIQVGLVLVLAAALGLISYNREHLLAHKPTSNVWLNLILCLPGMFIPFIHLSPSTLIVGWINHLGEEFAWRGYLFRKILQSQHNCLKAVLISGLCWWTWHVPMFWMSPVLSRLRAEQMWLTVALSLLALLGTSSIYSWIYVRSGSIWAPTIMHLSWNLFRGILTGRLSDGALGLFKGDLWIINGEGIIGNIVSALCGGFFLFLISRKNGKSAAASVKEA
jgi:membrane protease YdiL (CAAX protease family)